MTTNAQRNTEYAEQDDKLCGAVDHGTTVTIELTTGKSLTGRLAHITPQMSHSGWFVAHNLAVEVENYGTVWVTTDENAGNEMVKIDSRDLDTQAWDEPLGELYSVVFQNKGRRPTRSS